MYFRVVVLFYILLLIGVFEKYIEYIKKKIIEDKCIFVCLLFLDREDYVICFVCGIGVKNWDSFCDFWSEY